MKREQRTYRTLKSVAEARQIFLSRFAERPPRTEVVPVTASVGAVLRARSRGDALGPRVSWLRSRWRRSKGGFDIWHAAGEPCLARRRFGGHCGEYGGSIAGRNGRRGDGREDHRDRRPL